MEAAIERAGPTQALPSGPMLGEPPTLADLEARWTMATTALWRPGGWTKLGLRLQSIMDDLVQAVALVDDADIQSAPPGCLSEELQALVRAELIRRLHDRGLAFSG